MAYVEMLVSVDLSSIVSLEDLMEILDIDRECAEEFWDGTIALTKDELDIIMKRKDIAHEDVPMAINTALSIDSILNKKTFTFHGDTYSHKLRLASGA